MNVLFDTTILAHAFIGSPDDSRTQRAHAAITVVLQRAQPYVCVQNIAELSAVGLNCATPPLTPEQAVDVAGNLVRNMPVLWASPETLKTALTAVAALQIGFWDAMIWAVAKEHRIPLILSEGYRGLSEVNGVAIFNPIKNEISTCSLL